MDVSATEILRQERMAEGPSLHPSFLALSASITWVGTRGSVLHGSWKNEEASLQDGRGKAMGNQPGRRHGVPIRTGGRRGTRQAQDKTRSAIVWLLTILRAR